MTVATPSSLREVILALQRQLGSAYPAAVTRPVVQLNGRCITNFLRNGPHRKVFPLYTSDGDHHADPDMSLEAESAMEADCVRVYKEALRIAELLLGQSRGGRQPRDTHSPDADDFAEKEGRAFDGIDWSVEYEGGAVYCDSHAVRYWAVGDEYVFLQRGKWHGDGNFALFTVMTVTPRTGSPEPEAARPASVRSAAKPREILELEDLLGETFEKMPARGRPNGFFFRTDVMNAQNTYVVDKQGRVVGLNLSRNDLTGLALLEGFPHLEKLQIGDNALASLQGMAHLDQLQELCINDNLLEDLAGIERLVSLRQLIITGNQVISLERLSALTRLQALYAHDNAIQDLSPLRPLRALKELGLANNRIHDISALQALKGLKRLQIENNQVGDFGVLMHLKKLTHLQVRKNPAAVRMKLMLQEGENQLEAVRAALAC